MTGRLLTKMVAAGVAFVTTACSGSMGTTASSPQRGQLAPIPAPGIVDASSIRPTLYATDGDIGTIYRYNEYGSHQHPVNSFGKFSSPSSIATDASGNIYIPDLGSGAYDGRVYVVARGASVPFRKLDDVGALPSDIAVDAAGTVYVANGYDEHGCGDGDVRVYPKGATSAAYTICDTALAQPYSQVNGVAVDAKGDVFVSWEANTNTSGRVREFTPGPNFKGHFLPPVFKKPYGVAIDSAGNIAVTDVGAPAVYVYAVGAKTPKYTMANTGDPLHIAFNGTGTHLFVADAIANQIDEYAYPSGTLVNTIAFLGSQLNGITVTPRFFPTAPRL